MSTSTDDVETVCTVATLRRKRAEIISEADRVHGGQLTGSLKGEYDALGDEIKAIEAKNMTKRKTSATESNSDFSLKGESATASRGGGKRYAEMFPDTNLEKGGFSSAGEYARTALGVHVHDPRMVALQGGEFSDPYGGFAVPPQFTMEMLDNSLENEIVRPRCRVIPMKSLEWTGPRWDGYDRSTGLLFGGITSQWVKETQPVTTQSTPKMEMMTLHANKLVIYGTTSNELLADSPEYGERLVGAVENAIGFDLDYQFFNGTGVGGPTGILNDPAKITVSKESGQPAGTILWDNLTKMFARMHPSGMSRCEWVINQTAIPQLLSMSIAIGTGGTHVPVMTESNGVFRILTRPVIFTEKVPALGTEGDISLVDFTQYTAGLREGMRFDRSMHVGFANDTTAFRCILRADGMGSWKSAITPKNGDTQSWVVTLQTR